LSSRWPEGAFRTLKIDRPEGEPTPVPASLTQCFSLREGRFGGHAVTVKCNGTDRSKAWPQCAATPWPRFRPFDGPSWEKHAEENTRRLSDPLSGPRSPASAAGRHVSVLSNWTGNDGRGKASARDLGGMGASPPAFRRRSRTASGQPQTVVAAAPWRRRPASRRTSYRPEILDGRGSRYPPPHLFLCTRQPNCRCSTGAGPTWAQCRPGGGNEPWEHRYCTFPEGKRSDPSTAAALSTA